MPPNFGILPELEKRIRNKQERYGRYRDRALADLKTWGEQHQVSVAQPGCLATA